MMGIRVDVLQKHEIFTLSRHTNVKTDKKHYSIKLTVWSNTTILIETRNLMDPFRKCKSMYYITTWKFKTRKEAVQMLTMTTLNVVEVTTSRKRQNNVK
jgi:hypothetical protein